ncbi:MAG: epoxyqueuosine reductase QueH, partial [Bacilli bacterium]|nr:epoxyqueuosine reductase QueH [Bacilli bacterium]
MNIKKPNYYNISLEEIKNLHGDKKPRLLLHGCCGPCSCWPLLFLCPHFDVTIMFNNSNIYPESEYNKRLDELKRLLEYVKRDFGFDVGLVVTPYDNDEFDKDLAPHKDEKEGGRRCMICYRKRMGEAYDYAEENGFDYFTT